MRVANVHKSIVLKRTRCTCQYFSEATRNDEIEKKKTRLPRWSAFSDNVVVKILYRCGRMKF